MPKGKDLAGYLLGRIAHHSSAIRDVPIHNRTRFNSALTADTNAGQNDCARAYEAALSNVCMQIKATGHVMGQNDGMMIDNATCTDVNPLWPRSINKGSGSNPSISCDVHLPKKRLDQSLPALFNRARWQWTGREVDVRKSRSAVCHHALAIHQSRAMGNAVPDREAV